MPVKKLPTPAQIGALVRKHRLLQGLTQSQLARELDVSQSRISRIEVGAAEMSAVEWLAFSALLKLSPDALFRLAGEPESSS